MYKKRLINPIDTDDRKLDWEAVKTELTGSELAKRLSCKPNTVNVWKRKKGTLRLYPHIAEKLIELLDNWPVFTPTTAVKQQPIESPAEPPDGIAAVSSDAGVTDMPVRKDHVYMIPQIEKQVVLIDLINRELNSMDSDRLVGVYRAIMTKII